MNICPRGNRSTMVIIAVVLLAAINPQMASSQESKVVRPTVALRTAYLSDPVGRANQIILTGQLGGAGKITLEGNTCTITQFGDPGVCTKIFFPPLDVKIVQLRLADPTGQGRRLFRLEGKLQPDDFQYFLIVPRRRSETHRLVVNIGDDKRRVITLEPFSTIKTGKPELCKNAKYRAEQSGGKVTVYAKGENPTAGWRVRFEQLPIEIFPPQFRLVCVRPAGIVAQVITPFEVKTSFTAKDPAKEIIVHDAAGKHKVPVKRNPR